MKEIYNTLYKSNKYGAGPVKKLHEWCSDKMTGKSLIDVCCGHGVLNIYLNKNISYIGVDFSEEAINKAKNRFGNKFKVVDMTFPLNTSDKYDNIFMCDALEHFSESQLHQVFDNLKLFCRDDSDMFFSISTKKSINWNVNGKPEQLHLTVWDCAKWESFFIKSGMLIVESQCLKNAMYIHSRISPRFV